MIIAICITVVAGLIVAMLLVSCYDTKRFVLTRYQINTDKIKKDCRIVLVADLHNTSFGEANEKLLHAIEDEKPDVVLCAGDLLVGRRGKEQSVALDFAKRLHRQYDFYYGEGNHEDRLINLTSYYGNIGPEYYAALEKEGCHILRNESRVNLEFGLCITGLSLNEFYYHDKLKRKKLYQDELEQLIGEPDFSCYQILIAHNPVYFDSYSEWGADLTVSGHIHGGIMRLPVLGGVISPSYRIFPRYDGGMFNKAEHIMIISRGLGTHTIPLRIFNPCELVVIDLKKTNHNS